MEYNQNDIKKLLPKRSEVSHKGTFGHVLNIVGCKNYTGAAYFSSIAPLKVGAGRSTLASEKCVLSAISSLSPDIILLNRDELTQDIIRNYQVVSIGCGLSTSGSAVDYFKKTVEMVKKQQVPLVIDADGLNILSSSDVVLPQNSILTPHPLELSRLMGNIEAEEVLASPEKWVRDCAEKYKCTVILKTHKTLVADFKGNFYQNSTGNSALAKGGSGDVLCGMITGFLAQALGCFDAASLGVYLHGLAGELASEKLTKYGVLASDLLDYIPFAIKSIL